MSAQPIYDLAPLGSIIRFSDGTAQPPQRHRNKLAAWENRNSGGRLIRKEPRRQTGNVTIPAAFTLHIGDYGAAGIGVLRVHRTFSVDSDLSFVVVERPAVGAIRILSRAGDRSELVHVAMDRAAAAAWLTSHGYRDAVLEEVTADEASAGRAAA
ncbi:hypothetical protein [Bosea vaviloviae]|uniref:Uncharacterized protein n=1 Tax=Bosea vaviloviae TaxID=1526658 RepID=A0A1D7UCA1_9HYPH|nr:hypothetical protein [Bosea vaviloviae]AOO85002.1 hypothetical protein BHK69_30250 [Bosea vaviloviae]